MGQSSYGYGVGDLIAFDGGGTGVVSRIASCNNVYIVAERKPNGNLRSSNHPMQERELSAPNRWSKIDLNQPIAEQSHTGYATIYKLDGAVPGTSHSVFACGERYVGTFVSRVPLSGCSFDEGARQVKDALAEADNGIYRAVAVYTDGDVDEFEIMVEAPKQATVTVMGEGTTAA